MGATQKIFDKVKKPSSQPSSQPARPSNDADSQSSPQSDNNYDSSAPQDYPDEKKQHLNNRSALPSNPPPYAKADPMLPQPQQPQQLQQQQYYQSGAGYPPYQRQPSQQDFLKESYKRPIPGNPQNVAPASAPYEDHMGHNERRSKQLGPKKAFPGKAVASYLGAYQGLQNEKNSGRYQGP